MTLQSKTRSASRTAKGIATKQRYSEALRKSPFLSFSEWAEASGTNLQTFYNYLRSNTTPRVDTLVRIAAVAGVPPEELYPILAERKTESHGGEDERPRVEI